MLHGSQLADVTTLAFPDPKTFVAGKLHSYLPVWEKNASTALYDLSPTILRSIKNFVNVHDFLQPFSGRFKGRDYDSAIPPSTIFYNPPSCKGFAQFISDTILDRLASGAISLWEMIYPVMPLTVEPSKPRLCNDNRFLNLWIKDVPFGLDTLPSLIRYVFPASP